VFPDKRLFVYDSGKLNKMIQLLKEIKERKPLEDGKKHKVLIFTQMSKMLDIFQECLSLYNLTYVRLDGSTKPDMRQRLVERFNNDDKIFCFISSTRSGGIGLNLTGANNVIFYDTDWNPAMDKQAQDRCHRIGQTRNVSIYRLISEHTIEENILMKNMQKRKLDEFIMEEGNFTPEFFEHINLRDILGDMLGLEHANQEISYQQLEKTLEKVEDDDDVMATKIATKEREELIYEDNVRPESAAAKPGFDINDNEIVIDKSMLPPLFKYGLDVLEYLNQDEVSNGHIIEDTMIPEDGINDEDPNQHTPMEEEFDIRDHIEMNSPHSDEEKTHKITTKQAMKVYKDSQKNLTRNYFTNF
jgi:E1A-binding protein p400